MYNNIHTFTNLEGAINLNQTHRTFLLSHRLNTLLVLLSRAFDLMKILYIRAR